MTTNKTSIQFAHANGFPASVYQELFDHLEGVEINYIDAMGHADYPLDGDVTNFAHECIADIEKNGSEPVVGIGHSSGGVVIALAALMRPELFRQIILLEPMLLSSYKRAFVKVAHAIGIYDLMGLEKRARQRKYQFSSRAEALEYFSKKKLFQNFTKKSLAHYVEHGLVATESGFELKFSRDTEADIFKYFYNGFPKGLKQLSGHMIYGSDSNLFSTHDVNWWKGNMKNFTFHQIDAGHLFPMEKPEETAEMVKESLRK